VREPLLRMMWLIRAFEERVGRLKRADEIPGLVHSSLGQEGVAAGVCTQLHDDEAVYSGHRAHGHALAKGAAPERVMAELMGRADGLCGGLGGSMHLVDAAHGFMGATGVVGGTIPLALGHTLSGRVAVVFFGDGAVQAGAFHESVNLAALWRAPLILVCENNGFAEFTPRSAHTVVERVSDVVAPYGIERETVDGNDALAVHAAFATMLAAARGGRGPFLLECLTTRLGGHYEGDPHHRRDPEAADPIARLGSDDAVEAQARARVDAAVEFARASPWPTKVPVYA
jgi:TPP-dependent pyruvate/acetoin dehydrogenase alpha subunit